MQKRDLSEYEQYLIDTDWGEYDEGSVIIENSISKEEKEYQKYKELVEKAKNMEGTQAEKAKKLGVSISSLRRARIKVEEYKAMKEIVEKGEK